MTPDAAFPAERLYVVRWPKPKRELLSLAMDEAAGRVRPAFATWARAQVRGAK